MAKNAINKINKQWLSLIHHKCFLTNLYWNNGTAHALSPDYLVKSIKGRAKSYIPKDRIADVSTFVRNILEARMGGIEKESTWFARLRPFFDKKFGPEWRRKNEEFWQEFDETYTSRISKEELGEIM
jgi:hypothetical protein